MSSKTPAQIKEELATLKAQYKATAKAAFTQAFTDLFARWPQLHSIGFKAFRAYFCDGDPCSYYARYDDGLLLNGYDGGEQVDAQNPQPNLLAESNEIIGKYSDNPRPDPRFKPESKQCVDDVYATLKAFDDETYEEIVGDNVRVTITRDGISTEDYSDHD